MPCSTRFPTFWLIGVQVLDGVGAGIFGALAPLVIADIMRGTGRYNLALGAIATVQGIGASLSGLERSDPPRQGREQTAVPFP